ncbi:MAG: TolC family protein [Bacteroidetes bacterium]|nr:TolC family protein [Bacteroidota bacterium]
MRYFVLILLCHILVLAKKYSLEDCISLGLANRHIQEQIMLDNLYIAEQNSQLMQEWIPALSFSANGFRAEQGIRSEYLGSQEFEQPAATYGYYTSSIHLSNKIFDWGNSLRKKNRINFVDNSLRQLNISEKRELVDYIQNLYLTLSKNIEMQLLFDTEMTDISLKVDFIQELVRKGLCAESDVLQAEIEMNNQLIKIQNQSIENKKIKQKLNAVIGNNIRDTISIVLPTANMENNLKIINVEKYPSVNHLLMQKQLLETDLNILKWDGMPDLYVSVNYSRRSSVFQDIYTTFDKNWTIGYSLSISLPLYNQGKNKLIRIQKTIEIKKLEFEIEKTISDKKIEYIALAESYKSQKFNLKLFESNIKKLEDVYNSEIKLYSMGSLSFRDIMQSRQKLSLAKQNIIATKYNLINIRCQIDLMTGSWDG